MHGTGCGAMVLSIVSDKNYVPSLEKVICPAVIAAVFQDEPAPFLLNKDGSVDSSVYQTWLSNIGAEAVQAFADCSELVSPKVRAAIAQPNKAKNFA
ncbi:hypothetical protein ACFOFO_23685 [Undibacterium arcticum]|uniref:Peptidase S8/S53 domain-containing protein n=1 Tax=Undibacterium arcticum TaxID=1762892 RepID=A0ABV7F742_9BURK